jgi:hypothetical protein
VLRPHLARYLPVKHAALTNFANYFLPIFVQIVFELCLTTSCDVEVFTEAANALFALYCIHLVSELGFFNFEFLLFFAGSVH